MIDLAWTQHCGNVSFRQQDALWNGISCVQCPDHGAEFREADDELLVAVADGVSNSPFPELASRFVIETLAQQGVIEDLSGKLIRKVHGKLCDKYAKNRTFGASTTLVAALCRENYCQLANVGDSRAYRIDALGDWQQISHDHTILNELKDQGQVKEGIEYATIYNGLAHCLVADDEEDGFDVHCCKVSFMLGDSLLLCSDGLHDTLGEVRMQDCFQQSLNVQQQVQVWREAVLKAGAPDNFSIILARKK